MKRNHGILAVVAILMVIPLVVSPAMAEHDGTPVAGHATPVHSGSGADHHTLTGTGAVYMRIANAGDTTDRLLGGTTEVAEIVEIHETSDASGVMRMRLLADGLEIPAGGAAALEPGGHHVMLIGLTRSLEPGMTYDFMLTFEHTGEVTVPVVVQPVAPAASEGQVVVADDLTITGAWSRPAPKLSGALPDATPGATPDATPGA